MSEAAMRKKDSGYGSQGLLKPEVMEMVLLCITKAILQKATSHAGTRI